MVHDVVIVGAGPAGLAVAIAAASQGVETLVLERRASPVDKACGEGILPRGVEALRSLAALPLVEAGAHGRFHAVRYVEEDGSHLEAALNPPGLGVRRTALVGALARRAAAAGASFAFGRRALGYRVEGDGVSVRTDRGDVRAKLLVAADGLHSSLRRQARLEAPAPGPRRYGMRRHFRVAPWAARVEVHLSDRGEAYVTPVSADEVGVAFLWERGRAPLPASHDVWLRRFPALAARLRGGTPSTNVLGAGPLAQAARSAVAHRLVLVGDAAGYVDALTGEGLSIAFECAVMLGAMLPGILREGATERALMAYAREHRRLFRRYALLTRGALTLARHPRLRRAALRAFASRPAAFSSLVAWALDARPAP